MNRTLVLIAAVVIVAAAGIGGYWFGLQGRQPSDETDSRAIAYWRAPMNPEEIYDSPGKSAMGMDLVPVYADEISSTSVGESAPTYTQRMNVKTAPVRRMDLSRTIRTVGEVAYDEERLHAVSSKTDGWIEVLHVNFVGDRVEMGATMMEIYAPDIVATQHEYLLALNNYEALKKAGATYVQDDAEDLLEAARERLAYWDVPEAEVIRLTESGEVRRTIDLVAPTSGVVVNQNVLPGTYVNEGTTLIEIADLRQVWVHVSVFDHELAWISVGQESRMTLPYQPGKLYSGSVSYIYPYLRDEARDAHIRLVFDNPNLELVPGMYVNVELEGQTLQDVLAVPVGAVLRSGTRDIVFVARGDGQFMPRTVSLGVEGGPRNEYIQVLDGVQEGDQIVTSGQFMLNSESRLQEALDAMAPDSTSHHNH